MIDSIIFDLGGIPPLLLFFSKIRLTLIVEVQLYG